MQEEAEHRMVLVVEGVAKLTPRLFAKALRQALRLGKGTVKLGWKGAKLPVKLYKHNLNKERHGKMTVKQLSRQNRGGVMSEIEVKDTETGIRKFVPIAKKYGIDFAIRKVEPRSNSENADSKAKQGAEGEPIAKKFNYLIFFKGADEETVLRAFQEYNDKYDPKKSQEQNEQDEQEPEKKPEQGQPARDGKAQPQKQSKERAQPQNQAQKQPKGSKAKPQTKKRAKSRAREKRPSLLKRLEQKKREVEDQRREIQRAPQELSR